MFKILEQFTILQEDYTKCNWAHYFRVLPQNFDNLGSNFTDEEINMAQGTSFATIKEDIRLTNHNQYYSMVGLAKSYNVSLPFNQIGQETATKIIESRGRFSKYTKKNQMSGKTTNELTWTELVPYLDFINFAHPDTETANVGSIEFDEKKKGYFVKASHAIRQGE